MITANAKAELSSRLVNIPADGVELEGMLALPAAARGIVVFAHGSGSSRHSPRNNFVARSLQGSGCGTLLFDLLTRKEDVAYDTRFDIALLTGRLEQATRWLMQQPYSAKLDVGYFGASTGAAAALHAAASFGAKISAVVSRGGRPDLAMAALARVKAPTLLIVGALDHVVIDLNRQAYEKLTSKKQLTIVPGASHLFEEEGTLEEVARLAADWFASHFKQENGGSKSSSCSNRSKR